MKVDKMLLVGIIQGVLADPGFPTREAKKVVGKSLEIYEAMEELTKEVVADVAAKVATTVKK